MGSNDLDLRWFLLNSLSDLPGIPAVYAVSMILLAGAFLALTVLPSLKVAKETTANAEKPPFWSSDALYLIVGGLFILVARWPGLLAPILNVDEGYFLGPAITLLKKDPIFWRSVDTTTSGPLNVYILLLPALFGFRLEYAVGRIIGLILVVITCCFFYQALRQLYEKPVVRIIAAPLFATYALLLHADYVHYTSEHLPIAVLSICLFLVCRFSNVPRGNQEGVIAYTLGFLIGTLPYAKLQALPIAIMLLGSFLHLCYTKSGDRRAVMNICVPLAAGLATFSAILLTCVIGFGVWESFWVSYIRHNIFFSNFAISLKDRAIAIAKLLYRTPQDVWLFFGAIFGVLAVGAPRLIGRYRRATADSAGSGAKSDTFVFLYYGIAMLIGSIHAVLQPARDFVHYTLFLFVPGAFLIAVFVAESLKLQQAVPIEKPWITLPRVRTAVLAAIGMGVVMRVVLGNPFLAGREYFLATYTSPIVKEILKHASPGDYLAIWGWAPGWFVETGMPMATEDPVPQWQFRPNPQHTYFVRRYVTEFQRSRPAVFVDVMIPGNLAYNWLKVQGLKYQEVPEIAALIQADYRQVSEVEGVKIYVRVNP